MTQKQAKEIEKLRLLTKEKIIEDIIRERIQEITKIPPQKKIEDIVGNLIKSKIDHNIIRRRTTTNLNSEEDEKEDSWFEENKETL